MAMANSKTLFIGSWFEVINLNRCFAEALLIRAINLRVSKVLNHFKSILYSKPFS
jgi:hypothetical protein